MSLKYEPSSEPLQNSAKYCEPYLPDLVVAHDGKGVVFDAVERVQCLPLPSEERTP